MESEASVRIAGELRVVVGRLRRRLREIADVGDLSPSQVSVLSRLEKDGGASASELAAKERVRPQSMAATLAVLDEQGLIRRDADPQDGRRQLVSLTDTGRQVLLANRRRRSEWLARRITELDPDDREVLRRAVGILERINAA